MHGQLPMAEYHTVITEALKTSPQDFFRILQQVQAARANGTPLSDIRTSTGTALNQLADHMMEKELTGNFDKCNLGGESTEKQKGQDPMDIDTLNQASPQQPRQWRHTLGNSSQGYGVGQ